MPEHPGCSLAALFSPYAEVLPYLREAFTATLEVVRSDIESHGAHLTNELTGMVAELCDPDPLRRGHPRERRPGGNPYSLERYVSRLNLLAERQEILLRRARSS